MNLATCAESCTDSKKLKTLREKSCKAWNYKVPKIIKEEEEKRLNNKKFEEI